MRERERSLMSFSLVSVVAWAQALRLLACSRVGLELPSPAIRPAAGLPAGTAFLEAFTRMDSSGTRMGRDGWPLIMGDDPGVPGRVRAMTNRRFKSCRLQATALVPFMRLSVPMPLASCGMQMREVSCDERSGRLQRRCAESVSTRQHWMI